QRLFAPEEVAVVDRFLDSGGNVLLAFDPTLKKEALQPTGFEDSLAKRGILLGNDLVIENDQNRQLPGNLGDLFITIDLGTHRLTDTIRKRGGGVLVAVARSVAAAPKTDAEVIMQTSPSAIAEYDLTEAFDDGGDANIEARVVPLAVAWEYVPPLGDDLKPAPSEGPEPGRLMVIGDSDWMSAELLDNPQLSNIDLLSSTAGWLTKREAMINIAPRKAKARSVIMSDADLADLFFRVVVLLPLAALIAGFGVWWTRRT
ncbi:MAG: hypothetical protein WBG86_06560, partial [Polyangiales bacterium]